jgi:hypothetical protein
MFSEVFVGLKGSQFCSSVTSANIEPFLFPSIF